MKTNRNVKLQAYVPNSLLRTIRHEAIDRNMTIGELVEEAFQTRVIYIQRPSNEPKKPA